MLTMTDTPKKLNAKIKHLCSKQGVGPSELSRIADVSPQAASAYLTHSIPSAAALARIAQHFGVSIRWLLDDEESPSAPKSEAQLLTDNELMMEISRRYRITIMGLSEALDVAESQDLMDIAVKLFSNGLGAELPEWYDKRIGEAINAGDWAVTNAQLYSADNYAYSHHDALPGSDDPADHYLATFIADRCAELKKKSYGLLWLRLFFTLRSQYEQWPARRDHYLSMVPRFLDQIIRGNAPDPTEHPLVMDAKRIDPQGGQAVVWGEQAENEKRRMRMQGFKFDDEK